MAGRKIVDERDARACLAAQAKSGETLREWARRKGIDGRSLHTWQLNLSRRAPMSGVVELVPRAAVAQAIPRRYVVSVGAGSVEIGDDFDADTLARIVEVLSC